METRLLKDSVKGDECIKLSRGLEPGSEVVIHGRVKHEGIFSISLQCGKDETCDIAFQFSPLCNKRMIVLHNRKNGVWAAEESDLPRFPFKQGEDFKISIMTTPDFYQVLVNGQRCCNYRHQIPPSEVHYLKLGPGAFYYEAVIKNNSRTPFSAKFKGGLKVGQEVWVRGMVKDAAERFAVNFNCTKDESEVALHFKPCLEEKFTVLNSKLRGSWGAERRERDNFPFEKGNYFQIYFIATEEQFSVYVNENYFTSFPYRSRRKDIKHLTVNGDVELQDVELLDPLPNDFIKEIPSGLEKNDLVAIKGFFYPEGNRFAVNLIRGTTYQGNIAIFINPRRYQGAVVLNSRVEGRWQIEKREPLPNTLQAVVPFEMEILVKKKKVQGQQEVKDIIANVYINNKKLRTFKGREAVESIQAVNVSGEAYFHEIILLHKLTIPYTDRLPRILEPGNWLIIRGKTEEDPEKFVINLQCGSDPFREDIAFHFSPNFREQQVVHNFKRGGCWGREDRDQPCFPFKQKDKFEVAIVVLQQNFRVFVNKQHFTDYNFHVGLDKICYIYLDGDCNYFEPEFY